MTSAARVQALHPIVAGNSRMTLVAAVAPDPGSYLDTCNTLRLATRSQAIATRMLRNHSAGPSLDIPPVWEALPAEVCTIPTCHMKWPHLQSLEGGGSCSEQLCVAAGAGDAALTRAWRVRFSGS